jgi:chromosome segregation ATPase
MITDAKDTPPTDDLRTHFERLQADLNIVQNELDQALTVWRAILSTEKQEFKKLLEDREKVWDREEATWQKDRQAYEQKIADLEAFFNKQITTTEQNAVRALNELDAAWQAERLRWQQTVGQDAKEVRQRDELQKVSLQQLEQRVAQLEDENNRLRASQSELHQTYAGQEQQLQAQISTLEAQLNEWQAEKNAWQQSLSERMNELRQNEDLWMAERQQKESLILSLQQDLVNVERRLRAAEASYRPQPSQLESYVGQLESQIASLQDFLQKVLPPSHPLRRRNDRVWSGGEPVSSYRAGY